MCIRDRLELEQETGRRIYTVLQLRLHPALMAFRDELRKQPAKRHKVQLSYLTARGRWYDVSWKGVEDLCHALSLKGPG